MFSHACLFFVSFLCPGLSSATPSVVVFLCLHPASFPLTPLGHSPPSLLVSAASGSCGLMQRPAAGSRGGSGQPCFSSLQVGANHEAGLLCSSAQAQRSGCLESSGHL